MNPAFVRFLAWRLSVGVLFVLVVSSSALVLVRLAPGDATAQMGLSGVSEASIAAARERFGLDKSLPEHLAAWISGLARFDLGTSQTGLPVASLIGDRMLNTASLAGLALFVAAGIGLPLGILTGTRPRSFLSTVVSVVSIALVCCPPIIGTLALLCLAASTGWLSIAPGNYVLPTLALALPLAAMLERLQSQAAAEALQQPDIVAAAARGVPFRRLVWLHAGRQALRPVLGVAGIVVASLFSGSVAVETLTNWPGLGRLTVDALAHRDLFLVAGCALAGATLVALGNLVADLLRGIADPRVRLLS